MAEDPPAPPEPVEETSPKEVPPAAPAPRRRSRARPKKEEDAAAKAEATEKPETSAKSEEPRSPRRATLTPELRILLRSRDEIDRRRPRFGRQARYRYYRIGRDLSWRRPRGLQSKQRRHYGYRPRIVRIGYRSPAQVRGLVPSGFRPVLVRTDADLKRLDAKLEAAVIARTVGTRRRLVLEESARRLGIRVLNPIVTSERET
jgi:large subunit ribosomal protein L32e